MIGLPDNRLGEIAAAIIQLGRRGLHEADIHGVLLDLPR